MTREDMKKVNHDVVAKMVGTTRVTVYRTLRSHVEGTFKRKTVLASKIIEIAERIIDAYKEPA